MTLNKFLLILILPIFCFSQEVDTEGFFYTDDNGLIRSTDLFTDYVYSKQKIPQNIKATIKKAILLYEDVVNTRSELSLDLISSYNELLFLSRISELNTFKHSKKLYKLIEGKDQYRSFSFNIIKDLVDKYLNDNNPNEALVILDNNKEVLLNHRNFTCGNGARVHYVQLGMLFFDTYKSLNNRDKALEYGFKYLLNNKSFSKEIISLLNEEYGKEKLILAFNNLEKSFVSKKKLTHSYFQFLDYTINTDGYIGIVNYENSKKTAFQQLQEIDFYKNISIFLDLR